MYLIKGTAIVYSTSSWSDTDNNLAAALNSSGSIHSGYSKWGVTFEYNAATLEAHSTWESISISQDAAEGWNCTLDGVTNGSPDVGIEYNNYDIDEDDFSNSYSGYEFKGIALYMDNWDSFTGNKDCWFLPKDSAEGIINTVPSTGTGIMICPVYVKLTSTSPDYLLLQYGSPIVINRYPQVTDNNIYHRIVYENGYYSADEGKDYCADQINFLELVTSETYSPNEEHGINDPIYTGIYANNEVDSVFTGESRKVIKVPSNKYLYNVDYGMFVIKSGEGATVNNPIHKKDGSSYNVSEWISDGYLNFSVSLDKTLKSQTDTWIDIEDTPAYKFVGICVLYTTGAFEEGFSLKSSDKCFFIARKWLDTETQIEHENDYNFKICYDQNVADTIGTSGYIYVTPVFEAQREVYLTNPIIVNEFPDFVNEGDNGYVEKDTPLVNVDFGHTIGSRDSSMFASKYVSEHKTNEFEAIFDASAGFVELFESWNSSSGWKNNMGSTAAGSSNRCYLKFNKTQYNETSDNSRKTDLHKTYINTAELDNNSLYLTISGTCDNITEPVGHFTGDNDPTTVVDFQAKSDNYEMIGFVVYFKDGANDLSGIGSWADPSANGSLYISYFMPILWVTDSDTGQYSASIKIDFSEITSSIVYENYLAISPVYLEVDVKTVFISDALDENGNVLSDLTANDKYKFSDNNGNEYGYNDSVNVHYNETIDFTCNLTETGVIFDSSTTTYSEYKLTGIEVTDGDNNTIINSSNSSISISYENFGNLNDLYIHPIYSYDTKDDETTKYKINNDTCRAIQLSADEGCYVNGNLSTPLEVAEWANVDVAIYPKSTLKISSIKNIEYWHSFGDDGINIGDGGEVSIYGCIEDIGGIDYNIDLYMKVAKQDLDVYHMSFLKDNLSFNTSSEGNVYVHSWSDKNNTANNEPINNFIKDLGDNKKSLILRGKLPIDYNFYSYSRNKTIKSISATTTHVIDEDNNVCPDNNQLINISLIPNTINSLYYLDKGSHFMDMYGDTNAFTEDGNDRLPGEDWKYGGNGRYYFIVDLSNFNTGDTTAFDYESYACGPLIGYINEREDDNTNAVILKEDDFFIGIIEPGSSSVTVYGYDTVDSEQYLMTHNENGTYNGPYVINITDGDILSSIREINYLGEDQIMPNDYCQYQTGNQYVMFRLRNPYSGKVLNYDDSCSYGVLTNVETAEEALGGNYSNSTHEQTGFLTLWEQRSLFNALNGKPTYVNEVNEWAKMDESTIESLTKATTPDSTTVTTDSGDVDSNNYIDEESYWYKYVYQKFGDDDNLRDSTYFIINTKTRRKAGRALVDNIDDWFDWYKREEQPGVITNGNNDSPGGTPLCFAGPLLNNEYGCCINSDAVRSSMMLGPGESITIPIIVLYKTYEENGRDTASYSLGFDIRNSLYSDPLYYEVKFAAKYHSSVTDAVSSQKASIQESTKYNVTVR